MYIPELNDEDANWYLPAIGQLTVVDALLNGQYWSSTAIVSESGNDTAYSWNGAKQATPRMEQHRVRAVRRNLPEVKIEG